MKLSNKLGLIGAPLALAFAVSTGAPAFAHHTDNLPPTPEGFSCKRTDLSGLTKQQLVKKLLPTTVLVTNNKPDSEKDKSPVPDQPQKGVSFGSGVVIDSKKGLIITNNHVIEGAGKLTVNVYDKSAGDNKGEEFDVELVGTDRHADVAVLKLKKDKGTPDLPCAPLGDSSKVEILDDTIVIGAPLGLFPTVTKGVVSAIMRRSSMPNQLPISDFIQTDAAINPGNSGGPLFNMNGEVIGTNTLIFSQSGGSQGLGFAIESNIVRDIANRLIAHGTITHGIMGVGIKEVSREKAKELGMTKPRGVLIEGQKDQKGVYRSAISPGGAAEKAGIKDGDVILAFGGHQVNKVEDLRVLVSRAPAGLKTDMTILRAGKTLGLEITLGNYEDVVKSQPAMQEEEQQQQAPEQNAPPPKGQLSPEDQEALKKFFGAPQP